MSVNFNEDLNDEGLAKLREFYGEAVASDGKQFLFDNMKEIRQSEMKRVANAAKQPAAVEIHARGEIKTMSDGTRYEVTTSGWKRLP